MQVGGGQSGSPNIMILNLLFSLLETKIEGLPITMFGLFIQASLDIIESSIPMNKQYLYKSAYSI
jgi:hypothetical protein